MVITLTLDNIPVHFQDNVYVQRRFSLGILVAPALNAKVLCSPEALSHLPQNLHLVHTFTADILKASVGTPAVHCSLRRGHFLTAKEKRTMSGDINWMTSC